MDEQLNSITLPSLTPLREFANLSLVDGLAFMQAASGQRGFLAWRQERRKIIEATRASIEATVGRFKECQPNFNGQIFLLGHSLGGFEGPESLKRPARRDLVGHRHRAAAVLHAKRSLHLRFSSRCLLAYGLWRGRAAHD